jgi:hypothetical protein
VFIAVVVALLLWLFLDAPALERAADASPIGTRRAVALFFLRPMADVTRFLQLDHVRSLVAGAAGRDDLGPTELAPVPEFTGEDDQRSAGSGPIAEGTELPAIEGGTREDPLRMVVIGDSFAQGLGGSLSRETLRNTVAVESRGLLSSGLTRPDFFNWPATLREIAERFQPDVTVIMLGGNDPQTMTVLDSSVQIPQTDTDRWRSTYADRVGDMMDIATAEGGRAVWVGLPTMREEFRDRQSKRLNRIYKEEAGERGDVEYVDAYELFGDTNGRYAPFLRDDGGTPTAVRASDGEHMTSAGYDWISEEVLTIVEDTWGVAGSIRR